MVQWVHLSKGFLVKRFTLNDILIRWQQPPIRLTDRSTYVEIQGITNEVENYFTGDEEHLSRGFLANRENIDIFNFGGSSRCCEP